MKNPNDFFLELTNLNFTATCHLSGARAHQKSERVSASLNLYPRLYCLLIKHYEDILPELQAKYLGYKNRSFDSESSQKTLKLLEDQTYKEIQLVADIISSHIKLAHTLIKADLLANSEPNGDYLICENGYVVQMTDPSMRPIGKSFYATPISLQYASEIGTYSLCATISQEDNTNEEHSSDSVCGDGGVDGGCKGDCAGCSDEHRRSSLFQKELPRFGKPPPTPPTQHPQPIS